MGRRKQIRHATLAPDDALIAVLLVELDAAEAMLATADAELESATEAHERAQRIATIVRHAADELRAIDDA